MHSLTLTILHSTIDYAKYLFTFTTWTLIINHSFNACEQLFGTISPARTMRLFAYFLHVKTNSSFLLCDNLDESNAERATLEISYMKTFLLCLVLVVVAHTEKKKYTLKCVIETKCVSVSRGC